MKKGLYSLIALIGLFFLTACSKSENELVGTWKNDTTVKGYKFVYVFKEDGTGTYDAAGTIMKFTYTTEGDKITFNYTDSSIPWETTYSIEGKTLNVKDSKNQDTLYTKVK